ncbi:MAG TPA: HD domain-containing protein, partial [Tepidisphaeraceae bacterium]|nr:HD domain-containing protein [Tepidisphaeraceae bacterium]
LKPVKVIGSSGTLENIAAMSDEVHPADDDGLIGVIERKPFEKMLEKLLKTRSSERAGMRGLDDQRKDQIIAGAVLVGEIFEELKLKRIHLSGSALREGILVDYLSRHLPDLAIRRDVPDPRRRSVLDLARRCDWHKTHSEQVARLTMRLFDELKPLHGMTALERELIEYGALLHDIGWHIGRDGHHKHSMYLILHGDLKSFSREEVGIIANIARYHRKTPPARKHERYMELQPASRKIVRAGAALLRIADGLDRSHSGVVTDLRCRVEGKRVRVTVQTRADPQLELWGAQRKADLFERVFRCKLRIMLAGK